MAKSAKTTVIEWIFFERKGFAAHGALHDNLVTFDDIVAGIDATGARLNRNNPANFWKDLTRGNPEAHWPMRVLEAGYTGEDAIGGGEKASFRFVPVPRGQVTAFPEGVRPSETLSRLTHIVQSLSMPLATKALARRDENWLTQVAARLAVVETHFAVFSMREVAEVTFLQTGIKMRRGEVDAAYRLADVDGRIWLVSVEVKGRREQIHKPQVLRAAQQLASTDPARDAEGVIPMALKVVEPSVIYTAEFAPIDTGTQELTISAEGLIRLAPPVPGVD